VYGAQVAAPTVVTSTVTQIEETTAVAGGNVTSDGGASVTGRGVVYSTSANPTTANSKVTSGSGTGAFTCNLTNLQPNTTYYVRAYAVNSKGTSYGGLVSFRTIEEVNATPKFVDLGLSVKWATFNVGATKPEEYGDYFAWGETKPKEEYTKETYKHYYVSPFDGFTSVKKYNSSDNKIILESTDDAAMINWGGIWRMPTKAEQEELMTRCTWEQISINNVTGCLVTGPNGNSIFLPMAKSKGDKYDDTYTNGYWSSSLYTSGTMLAYCMSIWSNGPHFWDCKRYMGCPIRPVCP
jgi:hypothetical protein